MLTDTFAAGYPLLYATSLSKVRSKNIIFDDLCYALLHCVGYDSECVELSLYKQNICSIIS
jgi:hypothetical protein